MVYSRDNNNHLAIEQPIKNLESNRDRQILETVFTKSKISNFKNDSLSCNKVKQKSQTVFDQSKIIYNFKTKTLSYNNSKKQIGQPLGAESKINNNFNKEELIQLLMDK